MISLSVAVVTIGLCQIAYSWVGFVWTRAEVATSAEPKRKSPTPDYGWMFSRLCLPGAITILVGAILGLCGY